MKNKLVKLMIIGFILGIIVGNLIALLTSFFDDSVRIVAKELSDSLGLGWAIFLQTILSGIFGLVCFGGVYFYEIESWSLLASTIAHFISMLITAFITAFTLRWIPFTWYGFLIIFGYILICFFIVWFIMYFRWKKNIKEMNEDLQKYKEEIISEEDKEK